jgi:MarR family 2-MHQ and catechol resistance regulon transcriptional repressor
MEDGNSIDDARITLFGHLVETCALLTHELDRELIAETDLPLLWYGVLLHLGRVPGGQRPMSELVNATAFTSGGVTRLVDRMEQAGLVERRPCPHDRRVTYVGLTQSGREALASATPVHVRGIQARVVDALDVDEISQLERSLKTILEFAAKTA